MTRRVRHRVAGLHEGPRRAAGRRAWRARRELIEEAWRYKQMLGGALRQAGIVAAGALYALDHNVDRLAEDHANAARAGRRARGARRRHARPGRGRDQHRHLRGRRSRRRCAPRSSATACGWDAVGPRRVRAVTHLDVDADGVQRALEAVERVLDAHEARRHPPHHRDHRRCPAQRRLLRARARAADGQEDPSTRTTRPSTTSSTPTRTARPGADLTFFEYPNARAGPRRRGHGPPDRAPRRLRRHAGLLGRPARRRGRRDVARSTAALRFADPEGLEHELRRRRRARTRRCPRARPRSRTSTRCRASTPSTRRSPTRAGPRRC